MNIILRISSQPSIIMRDGNYYKDNRSFIIILYLIIIQVTDSIYDLVGAEIHPKVKSQNVEKVFASMDINKDGVISLDEFVVYCNTSKVTGSLAVLP